MITTAAMSDNCKKTLLIRGSGLVYFLALASVSLTVLVPPASAESVYQLTASTSSGVDLTAMSGYYTDRMEGPGPANGNISFSGPLVVSGVSASNPFRLIGKGRAITVNAASGTGLHNTPLMLYNDDGVTDSTAINFTYSGSTFSGATLDVGRGGAVQFSRSFIITSANVFIHDGAKLTGGPTWGSDAWMRIGENNSVSMSLVGSSAQVSSTGYLQIGYQTKKLETLPKVFLGITNATVSVANATNPGAAKAFSLGCFFDGDSSTENVRIVLGDGGAINAAVISHHGAGLSRIVFDGGRVVSDSGIEVLPVFHTYGSRYSGDWPSPVMDVQGMGGKPIDVEIVADRMLAGIRDNSSSSINISGSGGFTKRGSGRLYFNRTRYSTCNYTGPTTILGGGIVVTNSVFKPGRGELALSEGTFLDLNGFDVEFCGATGAGIITNGAETASVLTLGYGNTDSSFMAAVGERISVVKTGTGTLTVSGAALANACDFTIEGGTVVFAGNSSSYGTVMVKSGTVLDISGCEFSCAGIVKEPGGTVLRPKKGFVMSFR